MAALLITPAPKKSGARSHYVPVLENGDHLTASEFLRRYEAMPEVKKAELINGIVYMGSPVRADQHGEPDNLIQGWLCNYSIATPGVKAVSNATVRLGADDVPQPDAFLRLLPEYRGQSKMGANGYVQGAPELVVEIAASSASLDVRDKFDSYRRAAAQEYLVWRTEDEVVDWWMLQEDEYRPLQASQDGTIRSHVFPGLWLHVPALLARDGAKVMSKLQEGLRNSEHAAFLADLKKKANAFKRTSKR